MSRRKKRDWKKLSEALAQVAEVLGKQVTTNIRSPSTRHRTYSSPSKIPTLDYPRHFRNEATHQKRDRPSSKINRARSSRRSKKRHAHEDQAAAAAAFTVGGVNWSTTPPKSRKKRTLHAAHTPSNNRNSNSNHHQYAYQMTAKREKDILSRLHLISNNYGGLNWSKLFRTFDQDRNGMLGVDQFHRFLRQHVHITVSMLPESDIARIGSLLDQSNRGQIDVADFMQWLHSGGRGGGDERGGVGSAGSAGGRGGRGESRSGGRGGNRSERKSERRYHTASRIVRVSGQGSERHEDEDEDEDEEDEEDEEEEYSNTIAFGRSTYHNERIGVDEKMHTARKHRTTDPKINQHTRQQERTKRTTGPTTRSRTTAFLTTSDPNQYDSTSSRDYSSAEEFVGQDNPYAYQEQEQEQEQEDEHNRMQNNYGQGTTPYNATKENENRLTVYNSGKKQNQETSAVEVPPPNALLPTDFVSWPVARMSDTKTKLVNIAKTYASNQRRLLTALAESSEEIIALGSHTIEATEREEIAIQQLTLVREASLTVILASSNRRRVAKLLRVWHAWFLKQRVKRITFRAEQKVIMIRAWSLWCAYLMERKMKVVQEQYRFLNSLQDTMRLAAARRVLLKAVSLGCRRIPLRCAIRRWLIFTIEARFLQNSGSFEVCDEEV